MRRGSWLHGSTWRTNEVTKISASVRFLQIDDWQKWAQHTSTGRKFALVEGLSHDLVCAGSIYHVHFAWQVWHGQYSSHFKFNKLNSFSRGEIDQNHVDKRILRGKGLQYEDSTSKPFVRPVYASLVPSDGAGRSILQTLKNIHLVAFYVVYNI